ncbi:hypothetical protein L0Y40_01455 [Candidatus Wolfebacteria bacterium]|nr:hypothetical protein [Candidatus Wolfebacteria bacterium]
MNLKRSRVQYRPKAGGSPEGVPEMVPFLEDEQGKQTEITPEKAQEIKAQEAAEARGGNK